MNTHLEGFVNLWLLGGGEDTEEEEEEEEEEDERGRGRRGLGRSKSIWITLLCSLSSLKHIQTSTHRYTLTSK